MKIRRLTWLCLLFGLALAGHAETGKQLVVHKKNGSKVSFVLSSYPEITFSNRVLQVTVGTNKTSFQIDDVAEYNFEAASNDSKLITGKSEEGTEMSFLVYDETKKRVQVGNNSCAINSYTSGTLTIPKSIDDYSVLRIGEKAFSGCKYLKAIIVPNTVVAVYGGAFEDCSGLEHIILRGSFSKLRYGSNIATINGIPTNIPFYVKKDIVADYKKDAEWSRYNIKGYRLGDANDDDKINMLDIAHDANKILGKPHADFNFAGGDANEDGRVNMLDIATVANVILGKISLSRAMQTDKPTESKLELTDEGQGELKLNLLNGKENFMAFQFKMNVPDGVEVEYVRLATEQAKDYQVMYNRTDDGSFMVIGYSANRSTLCNGAILSMKLSRQTSDVSIEDILFATPDEEGFTFNSLTPETPLSIEHLQAVGTPDIRVSHLSEEFVRIENIPSSAHVRLYAVNGQDYSNNVAIYDGQAEISLAYLPQGVYIINVGNQSIKIIRK